MFFGVELHDSEAELGVTATGQGDGGGRGALQRRHRLILAAVRERERESRGGGRGPERGGRSEGTRGVVVASLGGPGKQEVARACPRAATTRLCPSGEEEDDRGGGGGGLGRNGSWAGSAAGERQVSGWASLFYFCFSIYLLCFDLVYKPNHFNKS